MKCHGTLPADRAPLESVRSYNPPREPRDLTPPAGWPSRCNSVQIQRSWARKPRGEFETTTWTGTLGFGYGAEIRLTFIRPVRRADGCCDKGETNPATTIDESSDFRLPD